MPTLTPAQKAKLDQQWTSAGYSPDQMAKLYAWYESGNKATRAQVGAPAVQTQPVQSQGVPVRQPNVVPVTQPATVPVQPPAATAVPPAIPATSTPSMPASGATQAAPAVPPTSSTAPGAAKAQSDWEKIAAGAKSRGYSDQDILALKSSFATGGEDAVKKKVADLKMDAAQKQSNALHPEGQLQNQAPKKEYNKEDIGAIPESDVPKPGDVVTDEKWNKVTIGENGMPVGTETAPGAAWAGKTGETAGQPAQPVKTPKEMAAELLANNPNVGYVDFSNYLNKHPEVNNDPTKRDLVMQTWAETWAQKNVMTKYATATAGQVAEAVTSGKLAMNGPTWAALQLANPTMAQNVAAEVEKRRKIDVANRAAQIAAESAGATSTSVADHRTTEGKVSDDATAGYDPFKITLLSDELAKDEKAETTRIALAQNDKDIKETEDAMRNTFEDLRKQYPLAPLSTLSAMAARMNVPLNEKLIAQQRDRDYNAGMLTYYVDIAKANVEAKNELASENRKNAFAETMYERQVSDQNAQYEKQIQDQFKRDEAQFGREFAVKKMEWARQDVQNAAEWKAAAAAKADDRAYDAWKMGAQFDQQAALKEMDAAIKAGDMNVTDVELPNGEKGKMFYSQDGSKRFVTDASGAVVGQYGSGKTLSTEPSYNREVAMAAAKVQDGTTGGECTKWASDMFQKAGFGRALSTGLKTAEDDTIDFKRSKVNSSVPSIGSAVAIDNGTKYGHWGIVVGTNTDKGTIDVQSSNRKGDHKVDTVAMKVDDPSIQGYYSANQPAVAAQPKASKFNEFADVKSLTLFLSGKQTAGPERDEIAKGVKAGLAEGLSLPDMLARVKGFTISPERKQQAQEWLEAAFSANLDADNFNFRAFGNNINQGNFKSAASLIENGVYDKNKDMKVGAGGESLKSADSAFRSLNSTFGDVLEMIEKNKDKLGVASGRFSDLVKKLGGDADFQALQTRLTSAIADTRRAFAGSAVTDSEMAALENYINLNTNMKPENLVAAIGQVMNGRLNDMNEARAQVGLPPIDADTVSDRSSLYFSE